MKNIMSFFILLSLLWLAGCSGSQAVSPELREELDSYKAKISTLEKNLQVLNKQLAAVDQSKMNDDFASLRNDLKTNKTDIRRTRTAMNSFQSALENMSNVSPLVDSTNRIILDDIQLLKSQLRELNNKLGSSGNQRGSNAVPANNLPNRANAKTLSSKDLRSKYVNTLSQFQNSKYAEARAGFSTLIQSNPSSDLADNAQYWIGESFYMEKKYEKAIIAFEKVFTYSDRGKYDYAQFKLGLCYRKLGDNDKARDEFERLVNYYKDSELRAQAQNILNKLK